MYTFGEISAKGEGGLELDVSPDRRAVTMTFSDLQAKVGGGKSPASIATRAFSHVLPLKGDEKRAEIEFTLQGFVLTQKGATATMVCSVNGQTAVADFPAGSEQSIVQKLKFAADYPTECRLTAFLLVGRDSRNADAEVHMNVTSIDAEILPRPE